MHRDVFPIKGGGGRRGCWRGMMLVPAMTAPKPIRILDASSELDENNPHTVCGQQLTA